MEKVRFYFRTSDGCFFAASYIKSYNVVVSDEDLIGSSDAKFEERVSEIFTHDVRTVVMYNSVCVSCVFKTARFSTVAPGVNGDPQTIQILQDWKNCGEAGYIELPFDVAAENGDSMDVESVFTYVAVNNKVLSGIDWQGN
jgi:hypothetical protein